MPAYLRGAFAASATVGTRTMSATRRAMRPRQIGFNRAKRNAVWEATRYSKYPRMAGAVRTLHPVATVGFSSRTRGAYLSVETIGAGPLPFRKMNLDLQVTGAPLPQAAQMGRVDL